MYKQDFKVWKSREKKEHLTQSYDKKTLYQQKIRKPMDNTKTPLKTSITQRLRNDLTIINVAPISLLIPVGRA